MLHRTAGRQNGVQLFRMRLYAGSKTRPCRTGRVADAQPVADARRRQPHKVLNVMLAAAIFAVEGDPEYVVVGHRSPVVVLDDTRQRPAWPGVRLEVPPVS